MKLINIDDESLWDKVESCDRPPREMHVLKIPTHETLILATQEWN